MKKKIFAERNAIEIPSGEVCRAENFPTLPTPSQRIFVKLVTKPACGGSYELARKQILFVCRQLKEKSFYCSISSSIDMAALQNGLGTRHQKAGAKVTVVLGAQWGDEGKGKLVDILSSNADLVCRCQVSTSKNNLLITVPMKQWCL